MVGSSPVAKAKVFAEDWIGGNTGPIRIPETIRSNLLAEAQHAAECRPGDTEFVKFRLADYLAAWVRGTCPECGRRGAEMGADKGVCSCGFCYGMSQAQMKQWRQHGDIVDDLPEEEDPWDEALAAEDAADDE